MWSDVRLAEVARTIQYGYTATATYAVGGVRFVRITDITSGRINWASVPGCEIDNGALEKYRLQEGDLLVARSGASAGSVARYSGETDAVFASYLIRIQADTQRIEDQFLNAVLHSPSWWDYVGQNSGGSAQPQFNGPVLREFMFALPPLDEQRRISSVLAALDDKIDSNRRLVALLEETAAALFRARFVDFVGVEEFEESEIGPIPRGWSVAPLNAVAEVNALSHTSRDHPQEIQYLDISSVAPRAVVENRSVAFADAPSRARRIVRSGDTLVSTVRPEKRAMAFVHDAEAGLTASTGFAVVSPTKAAPTYVYRWVTSDACIDNLAAAATGSAYPAVNPMVLASWSIPLPPDAGAEYEATARPLEAARHSWTAESRLLASIRDALLPKLISGEIRVPDTSDVEEVIRPVAEELASGAS